MRGNNNDIVLRAHSVLCQKALQQVKCPQSPLSSYGMMILLRNHSIEGISALMPSRYLTTQVIIVLFHTIEFSPTDIVVQYCWQQVCNHSKLFQINFKASLGNIIHLNEHSNQRCQRSKHKSDEYKNEIYISPSDCL